MAMKSGLTGHVKKVWYLSRLQLSQVTHNLPTKEFQVIRGSDKAVLQYVEPSPELMVLEHTIVPESLKGQGIGKMLAEAAFKYALDNDRKIQIKCDFVQKYLEKSPKEEVIKILVK